MSERKRRILMVDDDSSMLKMYRKRFELNGYEVITANGGEDALVKVREQSPDIVILDIMMPRLSGCDVCTRIKQDPATQRIPVIMFTAKGQPREEAPDGPDVYLSKSCDAKVLLEQVKTILDARHAASPSWTKSSAS